MAPRSALSTFCQYSPVPDWALCCRLGWSVLTRTSTLSSRWSEGPRSRRIKAEFTWFTAGRHCCRASPTSLWTTSCKVGDGFAWTKVFKGSNIMHIFPSDGVLFLRFRFDVVCVLNVPMSVTGGVQVDTIFNLIAFGCLLSLTWTSHFQWSLLDLFQWIQRQLLWWRKYLSEWKKKKKVRRRLTRAACTCHPVIYLSLDHKKDDSWANSSWRSRPEKGQWDWNFVQLMIVFIASAGAACHVLSETSCSENKCQCESARVLLASHPGVWMKAGCHVVNFQQMR